MEDALDGVEMRLHGKVERPARWGLRVKMLRSIVRRKREKTERD
jgi:hypothetical protein